MNKRRWVAVIIALGLFLISAVSSQMTKEKETSEMNALTGFNALLYGTNELGEVILEEGNDQHRIAKLNVSGTISSESSGGIFSEAEYDHIRLLEELKQIQQDPTIGGVILEVNSPGGGVYESAEIAKEIKKVQEKKIPIYVSMKNMAASGGYYICASADKIFATAETVTGSIGVIMSGMNYAGLLEKLGVSDATYKSGALKDAGSGTHPVTKEEQQVLQGFVDSSFDRFVEVVADGRNMSEEEVRTLADGRIYDGQQALENGLIDALGFPDEVLQALKDEKGLKNAQVFEYGFDSTGFANTWFGSKLAQFQGLKASEQQQLSNVLKTIGTPVAPKPLYYYGGE